MWLSGLEHYVPRHITELHFQSEKVFSFHYKVTCEVCQTDAIVFAIVTIPVSKKMGFRFFCVVFLLI